MKTVKTKTNSKGRRALRIGLAALLAVVVLAVGAFAVYGSIYAKAEPAALAALPAGVELVEGRGYTLCRPAGGAPQTGYVFYPGAKVDQRAYLPYLAEVAARGYACAVVKAPLHFAILAPNAADRVKRDYPGIAHWAVGGHSLGGVAAAQYAGAGHAEELVLLAAYPAGDLSGSTLPVLSITGSRDGVLDAEAYEAARQKLPPGTEYLVIEGGNHSGFGAYGPQSGDDPADIEPQEQRRLAADATAAFLARCFGAAPGAAA